MRRGLLRCACAKIAHASRTEPQRRANVEVHDRACGQEERLLRVGVGVRGRGRGRGSNVELYDGACALVVAPWS